MVGTYLLALVLTVLIEGGIAYLFGLRTGKQLLAVAAINTITNLLLNYFLTVLAFLGVEVSLVLVLGLEILVVIAEWQLLVYTLGVPRRRCLTLSILANTASFLVGLLIFWI